MKKENGKWIDKIIDFIQMDENITTSKRKIRNFFPKNPQLPVLAGQKYPFSLPAGKKVDISTRRLLCLPAKLE